MICNEWMNELQTVYDHDTFSKDDKMGDAEFDLSPYIEALKMNLEELPSGTIITRIQPCRQNCLAEESCITYTNGKVVQDVVLRLRHVECGEVEIQLQWIDLPGAKGLWSDLKYVVLSLISYYICMHACIQGFYEYEVCRTNCLCFAYFDFNHLIN